MKKEEKRKRNDIIRIMKIMKKKYSLEIKITSFEFNFIFCLLFPIRTDIFWKLSLSEPVTTHLWLESDDFSPEFFDRIARYSYLSKIR